MNVTELARILKITPQELRDWLPQFGYDIGQKAIKINKDVAKKVIKEWPSIKRRIEKQKAENLKKEMEKEKIKSGEKKVISIPHLITVREFANMGSLQINQVLSELMKNGIFASLNEKIDYDTAWLVGSELGLDVRRKENDSSEVEEGNRLKEILDSEEKHNLLSRPPVIVVMGHVDHGKTKLLDAIRRTDVVAHEAGGITQHIGAYQVVRRGQPITFIDTPGHEAFTAMRSRGAKIADIAILVVAADDGVKPQTIEAYKIIQAAKVPHVVAINKIDKEGADINRTKQELSTKLNITPEDWGGKTICAPISALKGEGINELLDIVLLIAETEAENIKANPKSKAIGSIIESHIDKGAGPVATILIQNGTLRIGDALTHEGMNIGKVRGLKNYLGESIKEAIPATPVQIVGLRSMLQVGDLLEVGKGLKMKSKKDRTSQASYSNFSDADNSNNEAVQKINLVIKSDVYGSAEAIQESLEKINTKEIRTVVLHKGLGNVTDGDIKQAEAAGGKIIGFNVKVTPTIEEMAREKKVEIKIYSVIYDLINDIKEEMKKLVVAKFERVDLGRLSVLAVFRTEKDYQIVGGKVLDGRIESDSFIEIYRKKEFIGDGKLAKLQAGKQNVIYVEKDEECGIQYEGKSVIMEGDILTFFKNLEVKEV